MYFYLQTTALIDNVSILPFHGINVRVSRSIQSLLYSNLIGFLLHRCPYFFKSCRVSIKVVPCEEDSVKKEGRTPTP